MFYSGTSYTDSNPRRWSVWIKFTVRFTFDNYGDWDFTEDNLIGQIITSVYSHIVDQGKCFFSTFVFPLVSYIEDKIQDRQKQNNGRYDDEKS